MACHLIFTADAKGVQTRAKSPITYLQEKGCLPGVLDLDDGNCSKDI